MFSGKVTWFIFLTVQSLLVEGYAEYEELTDEDVQENDYYVNYDDVDASAGEIPNTVDEEDLSVNRIRRHQGKGKAKTLSPEDIVEVRGALKQLLAGIGAENPFTPYTTPLYDYRPWSGEQNTSSTTPTYTVLEPFQPANPHEELPNTYLKVTSEEDTISTNILLSTLEELKQNYKLVKQNAISSPRRSSQLKYKVKSNIDRLSSILYQKESDRRNILRQHYSLPHGLSISTTNASIATNATNVTTTTSTRSPELDIPRLLAIISELAQGFETNLTLKLNETLIKMSIPTCSTPTTTVQTPLTGPYDAKYTGSIIAKCFVCGLDIPQIPQHAHCADAFAGDFLPLVPVDASAKGKISRFRKYCKYSNVPGYQMNDTQPRAIFGRWTGGCAVRWIDLSGVYTQRTCRNRLQPTMGRHFASKRMAKLERTLWNIENGCIASPVATLVPLSRGISLYARFHACVCSGNWCNVSYVKTPWILIHLILFIVVMSLK